MINSHNKNDFANHISSRLKDGSGMGLNRRVVCLYMIKLEGMDMFLSFNSNTTDVTSRSGTPTLPKNLILTRFLFGFVLFNR